MEVHQYRFHRRLCFGNMHERNLLRDQQDPLLSFDRKSSSHLEKDGNSYDQHSTHRIIRLFSIPIVALVCLAVGLTCGTVLRHCALQPHNLPTDRGSSESCDNGPVPREWRSLSTSEKQDYINAVQCTRRKPSNAWLESILV